MLTLKVPLKDAEKAKQQLLAKGLLAKGHRIAKDAEHLYFPLTKRFKTPYAFEEREAAKREVRTVPPLREALHGKMSEATLRTLKTAYDTVGGIAILEVDEEHRPYEAVIGQTLLKANPKVKTVLVKDAHHEGVYRTQRMRLLAGLDTRMALHRENGVALEVDVEEVYFSARLSTERGRIMAQVRPGERVLVMFAGCGPYTCVLAKNTPAKEVVGVEINPKGHELALANIKRNKLSNASTHCGDVRDVVPGLGRFDRVLMPLPKGAETFLDVALAAAAKGAMVHFYSFLHEDEQGQAAVWVRAACKRAKRTCRVLCSVTCGQQAPHVHRYCTDFKVT